MSNGGNMADMFGRIMEMQRRVSEIQESLAGKTVSAEAGGGMVKVTANGAQRIVSIKIERDAVDPDDPELLEDLIIAGVNKALDEGAALAREEMGRAAGTMLPPGFDLGQLGF
jgi:nucleoid-associated protein EbfC